MKTFLAKYESSCNTGGIKSVVLLADNIKEAQNNFFDWLKTLPLYEHMWELKVSFTEVDNFIGNLDEN